MAGDNDTRGAVSLQSAHRSKSCFEPSVVSLQRVVRSVEHLLCKLIRLDGVLTCGNARRTRAKPNQLCAEDQRTPLGGSPLDPLNAAQQRLR